MRSKSKRAAFSRFGRFDEICNGFWDFRDACCLEKEKREKEKREVRERKKKEMVEESLEGEGGIFSGCRL